MRPRVQKQAKALKMRRNRRVDKKKSMFKCQGWEGRAYFIPYSSKEVLAKTPFKKERSSSDLVRNLSGKWQFRFYESNKKLPDVIDTEKEAFDTVTVNNVLNVIDSLDEINNVIKRANFVLKPGGIAYFKIYEGDKSGIGRPTKADCYQQNKPASWYLPLIRTYFENTKRVGDIIIAINKRGLLYNPDFPLDIYGNTIVPR